VIEHGRTLKRLLLLLLGVDVLESGLVVVVQRVQVDILVLNELSLFLELFEG
jgi:hypothetical protein